MRDRSVDYRVYRGTSPRPRHRHRLVSRTAGLCAPKLRVSVDNADREWAFTRKFDLTHARMLCMGIHGWRRFFQQCRDNLNPGGWLEVRDISFPWGSADGTAISDSPLLDWSEKVLRGALKAGIDTTACKSFERHLRAIGFVNLRKEMTSFPLGAWPRGQKEKKLGAHALENLQSGLPAISTAVFSRCLDMSTEAIEVTLMEARKDLHDEMLEPDRRPGLAQTQLPRHL